MKFAFTVQYNGKEFNGFQRQKNGARTVQQHLEDAIAIILREPVQVHPSGRTDAGVNAFGQVIHFDMPESVIVKESPGNDMRRFIYAVNSVLPDDISIIYGKSVSDHFHARFSCVQRAYVYRILNSEYRMAGYEDSYLWERNYLDLNIIHRASRYLIGEHDFAAFTRAVVARSDEVTTRRIDSIQIKQDGPVVLFYFLGSGFLHNMIRIVTGTLLDIGLKRMQADELDAILKAGQRTLAGKTVKPRGLFFLEARYREYRTPTHLLPYLFQDDYDTEFSELPEARDFGKHAEGS